jgi:hypothetical protein
MSQQPMSFVGAFRKGWAASDTTPSLTMFSVLDGTPLNMEAAASVVTKTAPILTLG